MAMNLSEIQKAFKVMGKIIFISQLAPGHETAYKKASAAAFDQAVSGIADDFGVISDVLVPLHQQNKTTAATLAGVPSQCKSAIENYLKKVVAEDLDGVTSSSTAAAVAAALATEMSGVATVGQSGSVPTGFAVYFNENWGVTLPQDPAPNVVDGWIDDDIIA